MICLTYGLAGQDVVRAEDSTSAGARVTPPATETAGPEHLRLRLLGTIVAPENGIAICLNPATGDAIRLRVGESFEGWVLRLVHGHEATFEKASQHAVLALSSPYEGLSTPLPPQAIGAVASPQSPIPTAQPVRAPVRAPASGSWMDGDGQMIAPPQKSR